MRRITDSRDYYKPFDYPWAFDYYLEQNKMHWTAEEVTLHEDMRDFKRATPEEQNLLRQLFRFFTQGDVDVAKAYYDKYIPAFKPPEMRMMLGAFASMEATHQHAYSLLLDAIGMPESEYKAFYDYQEMVDKHEYVFRQTDWTENYHEQLAKDIAVFSAFTEGLQLFSSFIILLNFPRHGKFKGMGQIVTWSVRDETLHVEGMIKTFHTLIQENPEIWTDDFKAQLYQICRDMVDLEDRFIDLVFEMGGLDDLEPEEVKQYIRYIADRRLLQLGLKTNYNVRDNPLPWVDEILNGIEHMNFFEGRPTEYSKDSMTGSWDDVWGRIDIIGQNGNTGEHYEGI
jgi:ribonucleoside-diphosphate reductase beta chain